MTPCAVSPPLVPGLLWFNVVLFVRWSERGSRSILVSSESSLLSRDMDSPTALSEPDLIFQVFIFSVWFGNFQTGSRVLIQVLNALQRWCRDLKKGPWNSTMKAVGFYLLDNTSTGTWRPDDHGVWRPFFRHSTNPDEVHVWRKFSQ